MLFELCTEKEIGWLRRKKSAADHKHQTSADLLNIQAFSLVNNLELIMKVSMN